MSDDPSSSAVRSTTTQTENEGQPSPQKKRKTMESEMVQYEGIVLNSKDLTTLDVIPLPSLSLHEVNQLSLSYHGVWCCSLDEFSRVKSSPLITSNQTELIVSLIIGAIYNQEPVDDISRFINLKMLIAKPLEEDVPEIEHELIFRHISSFLAHFNPTFRASDIDLHLSPSWNVGFDLWSAAPGYQNAAEIALIGRQLFATLGIIFSVKADGYARSIWPMIGAARWYARLTQRIVSSIDPGSKSAHLALIPTTCCTFNYLFKLAMNMHHFSLWLQATSTPAQFAHININSIHQGQEYPKFSSINPTVSFQDEVHVARLVFYDVWDSSNPIRMESWGKMLQDLGRIIFHSKPAIDLNRPIRHIENFSIPLSANDPNQVKESVDMLTGLILNSPHQILKQKTTPNNTNNHNKNRTPTVQTTPTILPTTTTATTTMTMGNLGSEVAVGGSIEEEINLKKLALSKEISSKINVEEDRKKYDILTGAQLDLSEKPTFKDKTVGLKSKKNQVDCIKECLKCRSRCSTKSWNSQKQQQNLSQKERSKVDEDKSDVDNCPLIIGQFDLSLKEFNRVCLCGGLWVTPS